MENITFWQYLKINMIWVLITITSILFLFFGFWIYHEGLKDSMPDILIALSIMALIWIVWIWGSYSDWKQLTKKK